MKKDKRRRKRIPYLECRIGSLINMLSRSTAFYELETNTVYLSMPNASIDKKATFNIRKLNKKRRFKNEDVLLYNLSHEYIHHLLCYMFNEQVSMMFDNIIFSCVKNNIKDDVAAGISI